MFKIIFTVCVSQLVTSQEHFHNIDDNIAMETVSGKNLDFSGPDTNRFSTFLSRAGEFFSDSDFGNKIKGDVKKPKVIHAVKVKEVSKETETNFPNKRRTDDKSLRNPTNQVKINKLTGILMKQLCYFTGLEQTILKSQMRAIRASYILWT